MSKERVRRHRFLRSVGVASIGTVAGCLSDEDDPEPAATSDDGEEETAEPDDATGSDGVDDLRRSEINGVPVHWKEYDLAELPFEEWPQYGEERQLPSYCEYPNAAAVDEEIPDLQMNTVTLFDVENDEGHHPLRTSRTMMRLLHCYRETDDDRYLEKAESISEACWRSRPSRTERSTFPAATTGGVPAGAGSWRHRGTAAWHRGRS